MLGVALEAEGLRTVDLEWTRWLATSSANAHPSSQKAPGGHMPLKEEQGVFIIGVGLLGKIPVEVYRDSGYSYNRFRPLYYSPEYTPSPYTLSPT